MKLQHLLFGLLMAACSLGAQAQQYTLGALTITHAHASATVAGQSVGGVFMTITNSGSTDRLLDVSSTVSPIAEMHSMTMDQGVMRMRPIHDIAIPAHGTVELQQQMGQHIMLEGLKAPLQVGGTFPLTLSFEKAGKITIEVRVEPLGAAMKAM